MVPKCLVFDADVCLFRKIMQWDGCDVLRIDYW